MTMSSLEIAELTGKRHDNVMADIERILDEAEIGALRFQDTYLTAQNKQTKCYRLPRRECLLVMSAYSAKLRLTIIDRMDALEQCLIEQLNLENQEQRKIIASQNLRNFSREAGDYLKARR